jgi:hypothetical protein
VSADVIGFEQDSYVTSISYLSLVIEAGSRDPGTGFRADTLTVNEGNGCLHHLKGKVGSFEINLKM